MSSVLTLKRAETVWKEEPFFLPPFLPPPLSEEHQTKTVLQL